MGQSRPLFVYFRPFLITISIQIEKSVDGVLGIQTRGRRMVDADETTELWRPPQYNISKSYQGKIIKRDAEVNPYLKKIPEYSICS